MKGTTTSSGFACFETALGACGLAWGPRGVVGVQLPERGTDGTRRRLRMRFPALVEATPPAEVKSAIAGIRAALDGGPADLTAIALDMQGVPPFHRRVYEVVRLVGPGHTASYGEIGERVGSPGAARAVGQALRRNPFAIVIPCHRILAAGGKIGGFTADGGLVTKRRMLEIEGALPASGDTSALPFDVSAAIEHLRGGDPKLAALIDRVGPPALRIDPAPSTFAALCQAIVYQQLTVKAAGTIHRRLCGLFRNRTPTPAGVQELSDVELRGAGLSRSKTLSLRDLAVRTLAGEVPSLGELAGLDDEDVVERLTPVRGIGRWTVEMLLIFRLGRPDVFALDDFGLRKGFAAALGKRDLPDRRSMELRARRWRPYRSLASWYLWRAAELSSARPRPAPARPGRQPA
jgi:methylated-DNA-[protein]-cysteine S-methyltransferase